MTPPSSNCPYPGLRPFDESNAHLFFGRERETAAVVSRLTASRFLAVTGESGCGKSSLILSGVSRSLRAAQPPWRVVVMQPGSDPFASLARALAAVMDPQAAPLDIEIAEGALRSTSRGVNEALRQARLTVGDPVLIVVDQFEEIFRFKRTHHGAAEEARAFVRLLLTATADESASTFVIITMRSDYLGECAQFAGLPEAINEGEYLVPRMTREQMRTAIQKPASAVNTPIAARLVARILNEVGDDPGELPVVQHALMRTWHAWSADHTQDEPMDFRHYELSGTLAHALSQHADETLNSLDSPDLRAIAERLFRTLTEAPSGGRPIRRPTPFSVLPGILGARSDEIERIVTHFAAPGRGFLRYPGDPGPPASEMVSIDITHESLITRWQRLHNWVQAEARDAELYLRLARDAELHATGERSLWRNPELSVATRWVEERRPTADWASQYAPGFAEAISFLAMSAHAERRERLIRQAARWGTVAVVLLFVAAFIWYQWREAALIAKRDIALAEAAKREAISEQERLQQRVDELTQENPQLSDKAVALRKENRALQWTILQLQFENRDFEKEIPSLQQDIKNTENELQIASSDQSSLTKQISERQQDIEKLKPTITSLEKLERESRAEWDAVWRTNSALRTKALEAGLLSEITFRTASIGPMPPGDESNSLKALRDDLKSPAKQPDINAALRFQLSQLEAENLRLKQSIEELEEANQRLRAQETTDRERNSTLREERDKLRSTLDALNEKLRVAKKQIQDTTEKLRGLDADYRNLALQEEKLNWQIKQTRESTRQLRGENQRIEEILNRQH